MSRIDTECECFGVGCELCFDGWEGWMATWRYAP
jgi:hypothetical protein